MKDSLSTLSIYQCRCRWFKPYLVMALLSSFAVFLIADREWWRGHLTNRKLSDHLHHTTAASHLQAKHTSHQHTTRSIDDSTQLYTSHSWTGHACTWTINDLINCIHYCKWKDYITVINLWWTNFMVLFTGAVVCGVGVQAGVVVARCSNGLTH